MTEPEPEYEYTLSPAHTIVLVRRKRDPQSDARGEGWRVYYVANSRADAERILNLLQTPQGKEMVRR